MYSFLIPFIACVAMASAIPSNSENMTEEMDYLERRGTAIDTFYNYTQQQIKNRIVTDTMYTEEHFDEDKRKKRDATYHNGFIRTVRSIHRRDAPFDIQLVEFHDPSGKRAKRATYNSTKYTWPIKIPYKFEKGFDPSRISLIKRTMKEIMENVCIVWIEEPDFDPYNNNYNTDSYLNFVPNNQNICGTVLGRGTKPGPRQIKTCESYYSIAHELLHTLGVIHDQQGPDRINHLTLVTKHVIPKYYGGTYKVHEDSSNIESQEFDGSSLMMYGAKAFSNNGLDIVLPIRPEELKLNYERRTNLANVYHELNEVYKCRERYCSEMTTDCGLGYLTRIKGICKCVCPDGFDPNTNCQQLDNENSGPSSWPDTDFTLYSAVAGHCPKGFRHAKVDITGFRNARYFGDRFFGSGSVTNYNLCVRDSSGINNEMNLPGGTYCVVKPRGMFSCTGGFEDGGYTVNSQASVYPTGAPLGWSVSGAESKTINMSFCCREDKQFYYEMELPRTEPFRLISKNGQCPMIKGMRFTLGRIAMYVYGSSRYGAYPLSWVRSSYIVHNFCTYRPPQYGCNEIIELDENRRSKVVKTPGFDAGRREPNRRCLYNFKVPPGSRIRITMDTYDIDTKDWFNIRRYNKWAKPLYEFSKYYRKQFMSEKEFLFIEYYSDVKTVSKKGIQFTAEVFLEKDSAIDMSNNGMTYRGVKSISENFEPCVNWIDAINCEDFPFKGLMLLHLLTQKNYCRNPEGVMERPWCYVSTYRGMCRKAYCDVDNDLDMTDLLPTDQCQQLKAADPRFCTDSLQRFKCITSCGQDGKGDTPDYCTTPPCPEKCGPPTIPDDGTPLVPLKAEYKIGETVPIGCNIRDNKGAATEMECTANGWYGLHSACPECPLGWLPYSDRCYMFSSPLRLIDDALAFCKEQGGSLFEIRNEFDHKTIRHFKQKSTIGMAYGSTWINAHLNKDSEWVRFDNPQEPVTFFNWSQNIPSTQRSGDCIVMNYERATDGTAGQYLSAPCNVGVSRTICEVQRASDSKCNDKTPHCKAAIGNDPDFCNRPQSYPVATHYCAHYCGECLRTKDVKCHAPQSSSYHLVSSPNAVNVSDVMEFACNQGLFLVGGHLKRACGPDGQLLGSEPICNAVPNPVQIGVGEVKYGYTAIFHNKYYLFDMEEFRIPYTGKITHWHYYGQKAGNAYFVIFRRNPSTNRLERVKYNMINLTTQRNAWTYHVPESQQISVQKGDIYGVFATAGKVMASDCNKSPEKIMRIRVQTARSIDTDLSTLSDTFSTVECIFPAVGISLAP